jgi:hypothetical protein
MLFAECIKIRPRITVAEVPGKPGAEMRASVELHAVFPPPIDRILEGIMANTVDGELGRYVDALRDHR